MFAKLFLTLAASFFAFACSDDGAGASADAGLQDDALIVPRGLNVTARAGGCGALDMVALTLRRGSSHGELYAALKNGGGSPACSPSFSVELLDKDEQPLATGLGGLLIQRFYRRADGSNAVAGCVGPGDITMVAITDLPAELALEDVGTVVYGCNFWLLDVAPIDGIGISDVQAVARSGGTAFTGALVNELDTSFDRPSVAIFPVNSVGRPLGVAFGNGAVDVPPGGSWQFETNTVNEAGVDSAAYPAHG